MRRDNFWFLRMPFCSLMVLWPVPSGGQNSSDFRKVVQTAEQQLEFRAKLKEIQGSWGAWETWSTCSSTCGNGIQIQSRHCLPVYAQPQNALSVVSGAQQQPGLLVWSASARQTRPGGRRRLTPIIPGIYGYGRAPYVAPLQKAAASGAPHLTSRVQGGHGSNGFHPSKQFHPPRTQLKTQPLRHNQVWAPLYRPGPGSQGQVQQKAPLSSEVYAQQQQERPYSPLPASSCTGEHARYRICSNHACSPSNGHIRAAQCSSYNQQPFMGRLYEWEPFSDVPEHQHCELNCRAVGFRFYVRKSERVIDGTPCGWNETSFCVAGTCTVGNCIDF